MAKYKNIKTVIDGITFDSKREAERYCELKLLQQAKVIQDLNLQTVFELQPHFKKNGKTHRSIKYIADFTYHEQGKLIIEDVKGKVTKEFAIKQKLLEYKYPQLTITIIK